MRFFYRSPKRRSSRDVAVDAGFVCNKAAALAAAIKDSVPATQETHFLHVTMLFAETVAVYCENKTKHVSAVREQNADSYCVRWLYYVCAVATLA